MKKRVCIIYTGGTIGMVPSEQGYVPRKDYLASQMARMPEFSSPDMPEYDFVEFDPLLDSSNMSVREWNQIGAAIRERYFDYDGFVVLHGTDTMAYTAAALSYLIQCPGKPIVLTGSQKPLSDPITDAKKNLLDSFRFACQNGVSGVFLVFSGQAILGTRAKKMKSKSYAAFSSINYPVAAFIDGKRVIRYTDLDCQVGTPRFYHNLVPKVFLLKLIPGMEPDVLQYVGERYEAVVIESYGVGGLPFVDRRNFLDQLESLTRKGRIVVIATQVTLEGSDLAVYEVGAKALERYHLLQAYDMTVEAVVTKLMWLLAEKRDFGAVRRGFYTPVAQDILAEPGADA